MHRSSAEHSEVARLFEQISASIDSQRAEPDIALRSTGRASCLRSSWKGYGRFGFGCGHELGMACTEREIFEPVTMGHIRGPGKRRLARLLSHLSHPRPA